MLTLHPVATPVTATSEPRRTTLPAPTGHDWVGTVSLHLVDRSRPDPWVPEIPDRHLMVQIWYPAASTAGHRQEPWMAPHAAEAYQETIGIPPGAVEFPVTHAYADAPVRPRRGGRPVVLYSPGLGGERIETTAIVEDLASRGYVVVTVDHVHDSSFVELPDGSVETSAIPELTDDNEIAVTTKAVDARVADIGFVLDQLEVIDRGANPDAERRALPRGLGDALDLDRIGIFGHSDGGTTAIAALNTDPRIATGVNLDGTMWTAESTVGSDRPLLFFGREDHNKESDPTWAELWANHLGPKLELTLVGSTHTTFTDLVVLVPQVADVLGWDPAQVEDAVGSIDGPRATTILRRYLGAHFDLQLRGRDRQLLDEPSDCYPEVLFP